MVNAYNYDWQNDFVYTQGDGHMFLGLKDLYICTLQVIMINAFS